MSKVFGYKLEELKDRKNCFLLINTLSAPVNVIDKKPLQTVEEDSDENNCDDKDLMDCLGMADIVQSLCILSLIYENG